MSTTPELPFAYPLPGKETFRVWELANYLNHSQDQIMALIDAGELGPVVDCAIPGSTRSSLVITRTGVIDFLKRRGR